VEKPVTEQGVNSQLSGLLDPTLLALLIFVVPGVVAVQVYRILVPTDQPGITGTITAFITYGALTLVLWSWLLAFVDPVMLLFEHPLRAMGLLFVILFATPTVLASAWRVLLRTAPVDAAINRARSEPTGWDAFFSRGEPCFVLFHLKGGTKVGGLYGSDSDASTFPNRQQIYVEQIWRLDGDLNFVEPVAQSYGGIINREDCEVVELFEIPEVPKREEDELEAVEGPEGSTEGSTEAGEQTETPGTRETPERDEEERG
jgi:hypothetical protein